MCGKRAMAQCRLRRRSDLQELHASGQDAADRFERSLRTHLVRDRTTGGISAGAAASGRYTGRPRAGLAVCVLISSGLRVTVLELGAGYYQPPSPGYFRLVRRSISIATTIPKNLKADHDPVRHVVSPCEPRPSCPGRGGMAERSHDKANAVSCTLIADIRGRAPPSSPAGIAPSPPVSARAL